MVGRDKISRVANGVAKLDWFEGTGVIKRNELGNSTRSLRFQPKVEREVASVQSAASVHETTEGRILVGGGPRSRMMWGRPLSTAMGIGGRLLGVIPTPLGFDLVLIFTCTGVCFYDRRADD
jgi:hypothetical protein